MSHIPSSAMPHAKPHEHHEQPPQPPKAPVVKAKAFPWVAVAIGGALAAGTAITAAIATRTPDKRPKARKPAAARKPRRRKSTADE